jgi:[ribosomal protein S5]-alanine N-acetyltransferase
MTHTFLEGSQLYLRGLEESDLNGPYFDWFNDAEVCRFNSHALFPNTTAAMKKYFEDTSRTRTEIVFAIVWKETEEHIGNVTLKNIDYQARSGELAIIIGNKHYWGKSVGKEAGRLLVDYAISRLNLRRIHCGTHADNLAMQRLALFLGMREEGRRKEAIFKNGAYADLIEYGMVVAGRPSGPPS